MHRLWETIVKPTLDALRPKVIVEIGAEKGDHSRKLLDHFDGVVLHVIDPEPQFDVEEWQREYGDRLVVHRELSLDALPKIEPAQAILIDGDHNWFTVHSELEMVDAMARKRRRQPPVFLVHDIGWPYGRRDLYYDPTQIPSDFRHPFERRGILPGEAGLAEAGGLNAHLDNAIDEGGERNGVLTAIEDFIEETSNRYQLVEVTGAHGIGIVVPTKKLQGNKKLAAQLREFGKPDFLRRHTEWLERKRVEQVIQAADLAAGARSAREDLERSERQLDQSRAKLEQAREEGESAAKLVAELQSTLNTREQHITEREAELDKLREERGQAVEELGEVQNHLERRESDLEDLREVHSKEVGELGELQDLLRQRESELKEVREDRGKVVDELGEARNLLEERESELETAREEHARALEAAIEQDSELRERLQASEEQLAHLKGEFEAEMRERERANSELDTERAKHASKVEQLESRLAEKDAALEELSQVVGQLDVEFRAHASDRDRIEAARAEESAEIDSLQREVESLRLSLELARLERDRLAARRQAVTGEDAEAVEEIAEPAAAPPAGEAPTEPAPEPSTAEPQVAEPVEPAATPAAEPRLAPAAADAEHELRETFRRRYRPIEKVESERGTAEIADALGADDRGALVPPGFRQGSDPAVDVVVCVHDALPDVRRCLGSLLEHGTRPFHLIVVNDGSSTETSTFLSWFASRHRGVELIENPDPPHGYTVAANLGVRASTGDLVVLLNSDTLVTPNWLERMCDCAARDESIGIVGALSNAASHQSVPKVKDEEGWATNPLPSWMTPAAMGFVVNRMSDATLPRFPFINGFCFAITRRAIEQVGEFDEENFEAGFCEENDFCIRAQDAGFTLAVADDAYVQHAKSRSYSVEGRKPLAREHYKRFLDKHGEDRVNDLLAGLTADESLNGLRASLAEVLEDESSFEESFRSLCPDPLSVTFVLPGMPEGSGGGVHSIYQETHGMRALGVPARIALQADFFDRAKGAYEDAEEMFVPFGSNEELESVTADSDVVIATHFKSVRLLKGLREAEGRRFVLGYYVQDYEPFFFADETSEDSTEALESYTLPGQFLFAKTHWLANVLGAKHNVHVSKVEPSIDSTVYHDRGRVEGDPSGPVRFAAMIRPRTPRRQPSTTVRLLTQMKEDLGDAVSISTFGCTDDALQKLCGGDVSPGIDHLGVLTREEVADLMRRSDVFVDGSIYQAFGRTALEAMACGCTAIVPRTGGTHEYARDGENALLVDALDPQSIYRELCNLAQDRGWVSQLQAEARATAARYSVLRAALSEYVLFEGEYRRQFGTGESVQTAGTGGAAGE
jgi:O-antigen biosynthesis protein